MNKKGFTLVELLAVITIIGVISVIAVVSLNGVKKNIDLKTVEKNLDLILIAAKSYGEDHISDYINQDKTIKVARFKDEAELTVDDKYTNLSVTLHLENNNRITSCIDINCDKTACRQNKRQLNMIMDVESDDAYKDDDIFKKFWC